MATRTYSPAEILCNFGGVPITAFGPDTFVEAERNEDGFTLTMGAGGEGARAQNMNRSGRVTFTLLMTSPENDLLMAIAESDELRRDGVGAIMVKDRLGTTFVHGSDAWIVKRPKVTRSKGVEVCTWILESPNLDTFCGGSVTG